MYNQKNCNYKMLDKPKIMEIVNNVKHVLAGDYQDVGEDYNIDAGADEHTNKKKVKYLVILSHKLTKWRSANEDMLRHNILYQNDSGQSGNFGEFG